MASKRWRRPDHDWRAAEREYTDEVVAGGETVPRLFHEAAERHAAGDAQWYKGGVYDRSLTPEVLEPAPDGEFASVSYGRLATIVEALAAGFRDLGVGAGDRVAVYGDTRMEWAQADLGLLTAGAVVTTVYTESSSGRVRYLLDDPGASAVVVENESLLETLAEVEADLDLEFVVLVDEYGGDREDVYTLAEVHERGAAVEEPPVGEWLDARGPDDLASLIYTSGTTGKPKGVRLTHGNFRANVVQIRRRFGPRPDKPPEMPTIDADGRLLSFLPLAHVFERTAGHFVPLVSGSTVAYAESTDTVGEDLAAVGPDTANSVPRVYERVYDRMREQAGDGLAGRVFAWAVDVARTYADADDPGPALRAKHAVADRLVYSTVREELGGNVEAFMSGGGSISTDLLKLFDGMGVPVNEGYGLTETSPVVSTNPSEDPRHGTLGPPVTDCDVHVDDTVVSGDREPERGGDVGELLVAGPNVFEGYWNRPEATADAFVERDGREWFRTGDIVELTDDGYLVYHDRLKQVLVLDTGKNVAPQPIEDDFATDDRVEQVMVVGDDEKFLGALVVPNVEALERWADARGHDLPDDPAARVDDDRVRAWLGEAVEAVNGQRPKSERIREFEPVPVEWTPDNDLLTPSMKKKRRAIRDRFGDRIDRIYGRDG